MNRRELLKYSLAASASALPLPALAAYPERPIRLVVPFAPGGATDVAARLWGEKIKSRLGTVVPENKGGGGGVIGAAEVARSKPDGETLLFGNTSTQVLIPELIANPPYQAKDFAGVWIVCISPTSIVVHESVPVKNLQELIAYAKSNPTALSYGSAGVGTMTNLSGELFKKLIGAPTITHIPYKGAAPGIIDLASGHIPMMTPNVGGPLLQLHAQGKVRILAIASKQRIKAAPDIPTAIEAGLPGMVAANFNGLFAPKGVPRGLIDQIAKETRAIMAESDVQTALIQAGFEPGVDLGPEETDKMVSEEIARWSPLMKEIGFKME